MPHHHISARIILKFIPKNQSRRWFTSAAFTSVPFVTDSMAQRLQNLQYLLNAKSSSCLEAYDSMYHQHLSGLDLQRANSQITLEEFNVKRRLDIPDEILIGLFDFALRTESYPHICSLYVHYFSISAAKLRRLSYENWIQLFMISEKFCDLGAIQAYLFDLRKHQLPIYPEYLNLYLSLSLSLIEHKHSTSSNVSTPAAENENASHDCILRVLRLFESCKTPMNEDTIKMIISHYITINNYKTLLQIIPALAGQNIIISNDVLDYLFYKLLQEDHSVQLSFELYQALSHIYRNTNYTTSPFELSTIEVLLDGYLTANDFSKSLALFNVFHTKSLNIPIEKELEIVEDNHNISSSVSNKKPIKLNLEIRRKRSNKIYKSSIDDSKDPIKPLEQRLSSTSHQDALTKNSVNTTTTNSNKPTASDGLNKACNPSSEEFILLRQFSDPVISTMNDSFSIKVPKSYGVNLGFDGDRLMRIEYYQRMIHVTLIHRKFSHTLFILLKMKQANYLIDSNIYVRIFDGILDHVPTVALNEPCLIPLEPEDTLTSLEPWSAVKRWISLWTQPPILLSNFDNELKLAIMKLSAKHLIPEEFLNFIEHLENITHRK